jgi:LytS/YehU family sensor histidine kinase
VEIDVPPELEPARLPAMILQPLVENAIKHGVARNAEPSTLRIEASRIGDRLKLVVSNAVPATGARARIGTHVGLANVARRIELRYGGQGRFDAGPEGDLYVVTLVVPIHRPG